MVQFKATISHGEALAEARQFLVLAEDVAKRVDSLMSMHLSQYIYPTAASLPRMEADFTDRMLHRKKVLIEEYDTARREKGRPNDVLRAYADVLITCHQILQQTASFFSYSSGQWKSEFSETAANLAKEYQEYADSLIMTLERVKTYSWLTDDSYQTFSS